MPPRHALRASSLALALFTTATSTPSFAQHAPRSAPHRAPGSCVHFTHTAAPDGRSIEFQLENECAVAVEGLVSWRVTCGDGGDDREHREGLRPGERRVFDATVDA